jgi:hypothetical protein
VYVVQAESLDRLSRDQEHIAGFFKQASFAGVRIFTLAEGEVSELHVGLYSGYRVVRGSLGRDGEPGLDVFLSWNQWMRGQASAYAERPYPTETGGSRPAKDGARGTVR